MARKNSWWRNRQTDEVVRVHARRAARQGKELSGVVIYLTDDEKAGFKWETDFHHEFEWLAGR